MALETLKGIKEVGGFKMVVMDELREQFPEKFNESAFANEGRVCSEGNTMTLIITKEYNKCLNIYKLVERAAKRLATSATCQCKGDSTCECNDCFARRRAK